MAVQIWPIHINNLNSFAVRVKKSLEVEVGRKKEKKTRDTKRRKTVKKTKDTKKRKIVKRTRNVKRTKSVKEKRDVKET